MAQMRGPDWGSDRQTYRENKTDWSAAVGAGIIAGIVFMMAEMLMVWAFLGQSPWGPPRMIAAMALGNEVLPPPATFDWGIMMTAMMVHFPLSIIYGLILGWVVHSMGSGMATLTGAVFGLVAVYLVNFYVIAPAAFPWFTNAQNWVSLVAHVIFGLVLGASYAGLRKNKPQRVVA
jgi:uncharacterized membrane protein YagU involved in acid resistance